MDTARLTLAAYHPSTRGEFVRWMNDAAIEAFLSKSFPDRPRGDPLFDAFVEASMRRLPEHRVWAISWRSGELVGHVEAKQSSKTHEGQLELVYAVRRDRAGLGIATEAVAQLAVWLADAGITAVAFINTANPASRRVLRKANFRPAVPHSYSSGEQWVYPAHPIRDSTHLERNHEV
jgi:RimJ/RimL family protein N-acetyltransferase